MLYYACREGHLKAVEALLDGGADIEVRTMVRRYRITDSTDVINID